MAREKSPGLKILWLWAIGTAGILVTSVVRTRLRDLEQQMKAEDQQQLQSAPSDSAIIDDLPQPQEGIIGEVKS